MLHVVLRGTPADLGDSQRGPNTAFVRAVLYNFPSDNGFHAMSSSMPAAVLCQEGSTHWTTASRQRDDRPSMNRIRYNISNTPYPWPLSGNLSPSHSKLLDLP